jgi:hypothetical protein
MRISCFALCLGCMVVFAVICFTVGVFLPGR